MLVFANTQFFQDWFCKQMLMKLLSHECAPHIQQPFVFPKLLVIIADMKKGHVIIHYVFYS